MVAFRKIIEEIQIMDQLAYDEGHFHNQIRRRNTRRSFELWSFFSQNSGFSFQRIRRALDDQS